MKNIILFGSTGMLGNYVKKYLEKFYNIVVIKREDYNIEFPDIKLLENKIKSLLKDNTIIINCAGAIPQRNNLSENSKYIYINSLFPNHLNIISKKFDIKIIHITTDCVFSGEKGNYNENDDPDETNIYGISKLLGENNEMCIIRTSIIGEEETNKKSLLEWVKSNKNSKINGYTNHFWNGVTCYQLSKIIYLMIKENNFWKGVKHIHSPNTVSKYELVSYINEIYELNIIIDKFETNKIDKSLSSLYEFDFDIPDIKTQINEQKILSGI